MSEYHLFFTRTQEPYSFLLETKEWGAKRTKILARDNYTCQHCGAHEGEGIQLHVHHKHYIYGLDPWEYKDSELITLCEECHSSLHASSEVPVYKLEGDSLVQLHYTPCYRCGGAGWFPEYRHVEGGICFRCHGQQYEELIEVVEDYAQEHNIDIKDIDDGFQKLDPNVEGLGTIVEARVCKLTYRAGNYCEIIFNNGRIYSSFLDYSIDARPGDRLDPSNLRYRLATKKNGDKYMLIKGSLLEVA